MKKRIREIISENLISLRKQHNYTQQELSQIINYSDKSISRWESGESLPDYETLEIICNVYGVSFEYMFKEHNTEEQLEIIKRKQAHIAMAYILIISGLWTIAAVIFGSLLAFKDYAFWQVFIWALALTSGILIYINHRYVKKRIFFLFSYSLTIWSTLTAFYCQFIYRNIWAIYLIGIPMQAGIIILSYLTYAGGKND